jgi:hypothetical protein
MPNPTRRPDPVERKSAQEALREAEERPLDFDATARSSFLKDAVNQVLLMKSEGKSEDFIRAAVPEMVARYPELFRKLLSGEEITPLLGMIALLDKIGTGEISHHGASVAVGRALAERYMPENIRRAESGSH